MKETILTNPNSSSLFIWDCDDSPPIVRGKTILWNDYPDESRNELISIPALVDEQANTLKARYLAWIYELGEMLIDRKRIIDHLELRPGFSYWWMTDMAQKFNTSGVSIINDAIKLLALEGFLKENKIPVITLISGNHRIRKVLEIYCKKENIDFVFVASKATKKPMNLIRKLHQILPNHLKALIFLVRYLIKFKRYLFNEKQVSFMPESDICFTDVLVHLDKRTFINGTFVSNYWTLLVNTLSDLKIKTKWLHLYYKSNDISTLTQADSLLLKLNNSNDQFHTLIESNLNLSIFRKAISDYYRIRSIKNNISNIKEIFHVAESSLNFWPLFQDDWNESLCGSSAIMNCLRISLMERIFSNIPHQKTGIYIQENQHWEMSLIHAWRKNGHGKLIGVPHTTVRYWDLRYFYDQRSYSPNSRNPLPIPDIVAVNGPVAKETYIAGGYSESQIAEVEALRYFHILKSSTSGVSHKETTSSLRVLICGDFPYLTNQKMLNWMTVAAKYLPSDSIFILKPHPAFPINISAFSSLNLEVTDSPLSDLFTKCDVVFTSNMTSAAVDAYCSGTPLVQMLDGRTFNNSPLRNLKGVVYVTNPIELASALNKAQTNGAIDILPYFYLDDKLPRWKRLLGISI